MSAVPAQAELLSNKKAALDGLYDDIHKGSMFPFWATSEGVDHDEVKQLMATAKAVPLTACTGIAMAGVAIWIASKSLA